MIAIALVLSLMMAEPPKPIDLSAFASPSYRSIDRLADLPAPLAKSFAKLVDQPVAERGAAWNATDVALPGDELPHRRFMLAAISNSRALIVYEHGGFARHQHLLAFETPAGKEPKLVANVYAGAPATLQDLGKMLARTLSAADHY